MNVKSLAILFAAALTSGMALAQDQGAVKEDFKPSTLNQPFQDYPQVNSQGYARFRIVVPQADSVRVTLGLGGRGGTRLTKGADGAFTGTTAGPLDEGFHYYHLVVDGGIFNDPGTGNFYGSQRWESGIEIPAKDQDFYALKSVPHGHMQQVLFPSKSTNTSRVAYVYTPPGYEKGNTKYPVLYLQHGWGENETSWGIQGKANLIMDNMIAEGRTKPFIVVMTYGMTNTGGRPGMPPRPAANATAAAPGAAAPAPTPRPTSGPGSMADMIAKNGFQTVLVDELIPYVDSHFRTIATRDGRAMAGLSMGAAETKVITLNKPEVFGYWGLFSGGNYTPEDLQGKMKPKLIYITYGTKETRGAEALPKVEADLKTAGYKVGTYVSKGTAHEFQTWRRSLYQMAPLLFK